MGANLCRAPIGSQGRSAFAPQKEQVGVAGAIPAAHGGKNLGGEAVNSAGDGTNGVVRDKRGVAPLTATHFDPLQIAFAHRHPAHF